MFTNVIWIQYWGWVGDKDHVHWLSSVVSWVFGAVHLSTNHNSCHPQTINDQLDPIDWASSAIARSSTATKQLTWRHVRFICCHLVLSSLHLQFVGFLRGGCSRGGGNWGTLRIPREHWGTLGKTRNHHPSLRILLSIELSVSDKTTDLVSVEENPRTLANGYPKWPEKWKAGNTLADQQRTPLNHPQVPYHPCMVYLPTLWECSNQKKMGVESSPNHEKNVNQWIPKIHIYKDTIWYYLQTTKQSIN